MAISVIENKKEAGVLGNAETGVSVSYGIEREGFQKNIS